METFARKKPINDRWVVKRKIPVEFTDSSTAEKDMKRLLNLMEGVVFVDFGEQKVKLNIHYDATQAHYQNILNTLKENSLKLPDSFWFRWKQGWIEFAETNMRDNAKASPPACCNKPPK